MGRQNPVFKTTFGKTNARRVRTYPRDLDQIHDDLKVHNPDVTPEVDLELPGFGQFPCVECNQHYVSEKALNDHKKSSTHKCRVRLLKQPVYTIEDSILAAGASLPDNGIVSRK